MTHRNIVVVASAVVTIALVACEKNESTDQTRTTGATTQSVRATAPDPNDKTIDRVTAARCERELACERIGQGKKWADEAACRRALRPSTYSELRAKECKVVLDDKVQACLLAMPDQNCDSVSQGVRDIEPCAKDKLCSSAQ